MRGDDRPRVKFFTRLLTVPLARTARPPVRVAAEAGKGFHILLTSEEGNLLHLCFTPVAEVEEAYLRTGVTAMRYLGSLEPGEDERGWLESLGSALARAEERRDWKEFLEWAMGQPAVALPSGSQPDDRITSGHATLIRVNTRCNARCDFCSARGVLPDLVEAAEAIAERIAKGREAGQTMVSFTGGEPTLRPDLHELIARAREAGYTEIDLQTNGMLLARPDILSRLVDAGLTSVFLSLHGHEEAVHDGMMNVQGAFRKAVQAVENCLARGVNVRYNFVLTVLNLEGPADFVRFVADRFDQPGAHVCLSFIAPQGWALDHPGLMPRLTQAAPHLAAALDAGRELGLEVRIPGLCGVPMCVLPGYEEQFDEYHDTAEPPRLVTRAYAAVCDECRHRPRCSGFWKAYLDLHGEGELGYRGTDD